MTGPIVVTADGPVRGRVLDNGIRRFGAIPYAAPPVGRRRFRPPAAVDPWPGVLDGTGFGPIAPQNPSSLDRLLADAPEPTDESCLFLNVWTPGVDGRLPVMVWIHGGAFVSGSGSSKLYHGDRLAETGDVVVVTINYRLGALGFLHLDHVDSAFAGSGNNGVLDQQAALEWVQTNIASFGGDPDRVTVFGESAGAMSIGSLLAICGDGRLFQRAILQSGTPFNVKSKRSAEEVTSQVMDRLGAASVRDLQAQPVEKFLQAEAALWENRGSVLDHIAGVHELHDATMAFQPVVDGTVLSERPIDAIAAGAAATIDLLVGTNADENRLFSFLDQRPLETERLERRLSNVGGDGRALHDHYQNHPHLRSRSGHDDGPLPATEIQTQVLTDAIFWAPSTHLLDLHHRHDLARRWNYYFEWGSPVAGGLLGACHALELPFVFDSLDVPGVSSFVGKDPPRELAAAIQASWISFARVGDPTHGSADSWIPYDGNDRSSFVFGHDLGARVGLHEPTRRLWSGLLS